ncbi:hypothetical protein MP638_007261 [Amoeboaphelidium occidentale]|nr:hypothetical protein MP638_007261 [Amoeboaphelidium occidentale]
MPPKKDKKLVMIETKLEPRAQDPSLLSPSSAVESPRRATRRRSIKSITAEEAALEETKALISPATNKSASAAQVKKTKKISKEVDEKGSDQEDQGNRPSGPSVYRILQFAVSLASILTSKVDHCEGYWCHFLVASHWLTVTLTGVSLALSLVEKIKNQTYYKVEGYLDKTLTLIWFVTNVGELIYPGPDGWFNITHKNFLAVTVLGWFIGFVAFIDVWAGVFSGFFRNLRESLHLEGRGVVTFFLSPWDEKWLWSIKNLLRLLQSLWLPSAFFFNHYRESEHLVPVAASVAGLLLLNTFIHPRIVKPWRLAIELLLDLAMVGLLVATVGLEIMETQRAGATAKFLLPEALSLVSWIFTLVGTIYLIVEFVSNA